MFMKLISGISQRGIDDVSMEQEGEGRPPISTKMEKVATSRWPVSRPVSRPCNRADPVRGPADRALDRMRPAPTGPWSGAIRELSRGFSLASGCRPVRCPVWTGCSGLWSGLTGPSAGRSGPRPGQPVFSRKNAEVASSNDHISSDTI